MAEDLTTDLFSDHPYLGRASKDDLRQVSYGLPPIPVTNWRSPTTFPRLDAAKMLCIDCETWDPELLTHGPGWGRGVGHVVGVAVGTDDGRRWYFPMRHTVGEGNLPAEAVLGWCKEAFSLAHQPKVFANAQYDLGWLAHEGIAVAGDIIDVQIAEPLLDEHARSYSLDSLAVKYLDEHKVDTVLYDWCQRAYGGASGRPQAANIFRAPPCLVGPYAEGDVDLPLRIWKHQQPLLEAQGLMPIFLLESKLPRILVGMRQKGIRVDLAHAERIRDVLKQKVDALLSRIGGVDLWAAESIAKAFDKAGITYPKTPTGKPSFTADWLEHHPSDLARCLRQARQYDKAAATFIDGYILKMQVNSRVHGQFHQLRGDDGGTIVGRFSSSLPNLENIPARDPELGPLIRSIWLPEEGERWVCMDYSQIQFRIMTHYAVGQGAGEARARYNADPTTDYHNMAQELIAETTGMHLGRKPVKNINFGLAFTMGVDKLAREMGIPVEEARPLIEAYHTGMPFVRATSDRVAGVGQSRGYIMGIMGRRHRFPYYEPREWSLRGQVKLSQDMDAVRAEVLAVTGKAGGVVRAFTHLGLNRLAQDGEGTTIKKALVDCYEAGLFDVLGYPLNIVHDDVNFSNPGGAVAEEALGEAKRLMEGAIKWKVPILVERTEGPNWGELHGYETPRAA